MFSFTFLFANSLMLATVLIICGYSIVKIIDEGLADTIVPINYKGMWSMVGFSIYVFEGIGILMPVMQACECPEKFDKILIAAVATLTTAFCTFGTLSYLAYGNMKQQMIT